jgi:hypothetical protein
MTEHRMDDAQRQARAEQAAVAHASPAEQALRAERTALVKAWLRRCGITHADVIKELVSGDTAVGVKAGNGIHWIPVSEPKFPWDLWSELRDRLMAEEEARSTG